MTPRTPSRRRLNGRAAFRAVEAEVVAGLAAGRTYRAIYEEKQSRLEMSYAQFARYAKPLRVALDTKAATDRALTALAPTRSSTAPHCSVSAETRKGPLKGRPQDAVRHLNIDDHATQVLENEDLF
jgi:hypothetical protein